MIRCKGELSPAAIDQGWPFQVALPATASRNGGYKAIHEFCKALTLCPRGHSVFRNEWFNVYCFAERELFDSALGTDLRQWCCFGGPKFGDVSRMSKEASYRTFAAECLEMAKKAVRVAEKRRLLQMAETSLALADRVHKRATRMAARLSEHPEVSATFSARPKGTN